MLEDLFNAIGAKAVEAEAPKVVKVPGPDHIYFLHTKEDGLQKLESEPMPRNHVAGDLAAIADFACTSPSSRIWYNRDAVVCLIDDGIRRDKVTLKLVFSQQIRMLAGWEQTAGVFDQKSLILTLRTKFKDCLPMHGSLVEQLRLVKWQLDTENEAELRQTRTSIGKKLTAQVHGLDVIPEYLTFSVPVFERGFLSTANVEVAIDPDPANQRFVLMTIPGSVERALSEAEDAIHSWLLTNCQDKPISFGTP